MPDLLPDCKVDFVHERVLADEALRWRKRSGTENYAYFDIVAFVERVLRPNAKRPFKIAFFHQVPGAKPAYVSYKRQITLHVDREVWLDAKDGDPIARFIIAHEIGHLLFHDHRAQAFSNDPSERLKFAQPEYSAEWQANTFAFYFLVPDHMVAAFSGIRQLSNACGVTEEIARERISMSPHATRRSYSSPCDICPHCGNLSLTPGGRCLSTHCTTATRKSG